MAGKEQETIFPISDSEAAVLHEMGWSSGFGWDTEWDWWRSGTPHDEAMESRDKTSTQLHLIRCVFGIRAARREAEKIVLMHFNQ